MDIRAAIAGAVAIIALVGLIVLAAIGQGAEAIDRLDAIIAGAMTFLLGLYSSPYSSEVVDDAVAVSVDEPAGVTQVQERS